VKIRNVKLSDLKFFIELYLKAYKGIEEYAYKEIKDIKWYFKWLLSRDPKGFFLLELKEPIAFIACDTNWFSRFEMGIVAEIHELFVHPDFRRKRIGSILVNKAIDYAKSKNRKIVGLWVGVENYNASIISGF